MVCVEIPVSLRLLGRILHLLTMYQIFTHRVIYDEYAVVGCQINCQDIVPSSLVSVVYLVWVTGVIFNIQSIKIDRISSLSQVCDFYCKINAKLYNIVSNELDVIHALSLVYSIGINVLMHWGVDESMGEWIKTILPTFCIVGAGDWYLMHGWGG